MLIFPRRHKRRQLPRTCKTLNFQENIISSLVKKFTQQIHNPKIIGHMSLSIVLFQVSTKQ